MQKYVFHHYQTWERKLVLVRFLKNLESNWKLEIDGSKPPKKRKVLSPYEKAEAPVEFCIYSWGILPQNSYLSWNIHWNSSGNWNTACKIVAWRRIWSWTLAISSLFSNELSRDLNKNFAKYCWWKTIGNKRSNKNFFTIKCISKAVNLWSA